jgi:hypothetical protein
MHEVEEPIENDMRRHAQSEEKLRTLREEIRQLKWMVGQAKKCAASSAVAKPLSQ